MQFVEDQWKFKLYVSRLSRHGYCIGNVSNDVISLMHMSVRVCIDRDGIKVLFHRVRLSLLRRGTAVNLVIFEDFYKKLD